MEQRFSWISRARSAAPRGMLNEWLVTGLMYLFATTTLVQAYVVPTGSMEGNLRVGDHMLVSRTAYGKGDGWSRFLMPSHLPERGDIVAFEYPEDRRQTFVKRVIGVPGDRIRLDGKQLFRNGRRLFEGYIQHTDSGVSVCRDKFPGNRICPETTPRGADMLMNHVSNGEVVVPPGMLFVMGDNRDNSLDSRYWGFVPYELIVGRPLLVYWSYDASTEDLTEWRLSHFSDLALHFFTKTRWERTFLRPPSQLAIERSEGVSR